MPPSNSVSAPQNPANSSSAEPGLMKSASVVGAATAFSRILGLVRVQLMAYFFGAGMAADAFFVAFRIPNLFRDLFAEGALSTAFVPVFKKTLVNEGADRARTLLDRSFTLLFISLSIVTLLGSLGAAGFVYLAAEGFTSDPEKFDLTVTLTRWLFPYLLFVSLASLLMGTLNSYGRFGVPAVASAMFNIAMILSMVFLYDSFERPVYCLVVGVLVGGVGQFAIQVPSLYRAGGRLRFDFNFRDRGLKAIGKLMTPIIVGLGASRINILVASLLASLQGEGAVSYLVYAYQLMHFPLGVFALAIGTAALPRAAAQVARGELGELAGTMRSSLRMILFLVAPSAVYLAFFNERLINLIYLRGAFTAVDASAVSVTLLWYSAGLLAFAGVRVLTPMYYAFSDARTPMRYSLVTVALNIVLSLVMVDSPVMRMGFPGLAAAISLAGWVNLCLLLWGLRQRGVLTEGRSYLESLVKTLLASAGMALALLALPDVFSFGVDGLPGKTLDALLEILIGAFVYFALTASFSLAESRRLINSILRRS